MHKINPIDSTGRKDDAGKTRWELVPWDAMQQVADVLTFGAAKYGDNNWVNVDKYRYFGALERHILEPTINPSSLTDSETGKHHYAHAICCLLFMLAKEIRNENN